MEFVKYSMAYYQGHEYYKYEKASNIAMCTLGRFLFSDIGDLSSSFKEFVYNDEEEYTSSNVTILEKKKGYVYLRDLYPVLEEEIENPTEVKMTYAQFLQLLRDLEEKVVKLRPYEVIIKCENDRFIFETTFSA